MIGKYMRKIQLTGGAKTTERHLDTSNFKINVLRIIYPNLPGRARPYDVIIIIIYNVGVCFK
jgi:hypothetical protein